MTTLTLKINERTEAGKMILETLKLWQSHEKTIEVVKVPNAKTLKAIQEARAGIGIIKTKSHSDLMKKLRD